MIDFKHLILYLVLTGALCFIFSSRWLWSWFYLLWNNLNMQHMWLRLTGLPMAIHVNQSPSHMTKTTEDSAEINCSHDNPVYDRILWYKHSDQRFKLIGNLYATFPSIVPIYGGNIKVDRDAVKECSLTIRNLSSADTGLYFLRCQKSTLVTGAHITIVQQMPHLTCWLQLWNHSVMSFPVAVYHGSIAEKNNMLSLTPDVEPWSEPSLSSSLPLWFSWQVWFFKGIIIDIYIYIYYHGLTHSFFKNNTFYVLVQKWSFWTCLTCVKKLNKPLHFLGLTGMSLSFTVHQKPPDLLMNEHDIVKLECSQHVPNYNVILWYKQFGD